jgi:hypothetical protein
LKAGHTFVTNGPLLRVRAGGKLPGHVFTAPAGETVELDLSVLLTSRDEIASIEIVKDGEVERTVSPEEWQKNPGIRAVRFDQSGWFLVRAIADNRATFRFASTAPFYVEIGPSKYRISKSSAQFFVDWVDERIQRIKLDDPAQRQEVVAHQHRARAFWMERVAQANAP